MNINTVGIFGYGRFGKLLNNILQKDFDLYIHDKSPDALCEEGFVEGHDVSLVASCDAVFFCVPILQFESAIKEARPYVREDSIIIDVCSVKVYPAKIMRDNISQANILPTHPMFGPDAARGGLRGLPFVLCSNDTREEVVSYWRDYLQKKEFNVVEMSCQEHDRVTAHSLCITQLLGRALDSLDLAPSNSDTQSFKRLLEIRDISCRDTMELFKGIQNFNPYAKEMRQRLKESLNRLENLLEE